MLIDQNWSHGPESVVSDLILGIFNLHVGRHVEDKLFKRVCMCDMTEERLRFVQENVS